MSDAPTATGFAYDDDAPTGPAAPTGIGLNAPIGTGALGYWRDGATATGPTIRRTWRDDPKHIIAENYESYKRICAESDIAPTPDGFEQWMDVGERISDDRDHDHHDGDPTATATGVSWHAMPRLVSHSRTPLADHVVVGVELGGDMSPPRAIYAAPTLGALARTVVGAWLRSLVTRKHKETA